MYDCIEKQPAARRNEGGSTMSEFAILTDSNADFAPGYAAENGVVEVQLTYLIDEVSYECNDPALPRDAFYDKMRAGAMPKTAAVNVEQAREALLPLLEAGRDVLCIAFSAALSATCSNLRVAAAELAEQFPNRRLSVVDSLCASSGEGMLVARAVEYRAAGLTMEETERRVREDIPHIAHLFTVDDLFNLQRGGRVSKAAAVVGTMLGIKPTLHVDGQGRLVPTGKVRGRKQSLLALVEGMGRQMDREKCECFAVSHGDCLEDAEFVAAEVEKRFGIRRHTIAYVGPTIGAHSGPGTVALFFYAACR